MQPLPHPKRIVVLTGHADGCQENAVNEIKKQIDAYQKGGHTLSLEMRFIGLAMSTKDQLHLEL